jgi:hypothetical protein
MSAGALQFNPLHSCLRLVSLSDELIHTIEHQHVQSYVGLMQEATTHAQILYKLYTKRSKEGAEKDALWDGYYALKCRAAEYTREIQHRGGLLFAWDETTAFKVAA